MINTLWFCFSFALLYGMFFYIKKTDEKQNGVVWCVMTFIILLCYQAFVAAILNLIRVPIALVSIGTMDFFAGGVLFFFRKRIGRQGYLWNGRDIIAVIVCIIPVIAAVIHQFGIPLETNYVSVDGMTHYRMALWVLREKTLYGLIFAPVNNAMFLGIFAPFVESIELYQVFILSDAFMYYLGGISFYCLLSKKINTSGKAVLGIIITVIYMTGYPRNSFGYGFNYLGISIILILYVFWVMQFYLEDDMNKWLSTILIALGCYSIGVCYSLFSPIIYFSICVASFIKNWNMISKSKIERIKIFIIDNLAIFLIPCILVFIYSFVGFFGVQDAGSSMSNGISMEGGIYRDLFSNFIFWVPFAILGMCTIIHDKTENLVIWCVVFLLLFMIVLGVQGVRGKVSSYYYYKTYFFMSALVFYLTYIGILNLWGKCREYVVVCLGVLGVLALATAFDIEGEIQRRNYLFAPVCKSHYYFDIYLTNNQLIDIAGDYSEEKLELYEYCAKNLSKEKEKQIVVCAVAYDYNVFRAITERLLSEDSYVIAGKKQELDKVKKEIQLNKEIPFVYVKNDLISEKEIKEYLGKNSEVLYYNKSGFVAIFKDTDK